MQHSVYLQGELGDKFGDKFTVHTENYRDIFKCIQANRPNFLPYVRKCHEDDIGFIVETAGNAIETEDLLLPLQPGDVTISLAPAGSKSGMGKILAAIAIIAVMYFTGGLAGLGASGTTAAGGGLSTSAGWAVAAGGGLSTSGMMVAGLAANLALVGMQQLMAPDPGVDKDSPTNYLFTGGRNNSVEGDPIPLLYGELTVPGRPISLEIIQGAPDVHGLRTNNVSIDRGNNLNIVRVPEAG